MRSRRVRQLKVAACKTEREEVKKKRMRWIFSLQASNLFLLIPLLFPLALLQLTQVEASSLITNSEHSGSGQRYVSLPKLGILRGRSIALSSDEETDEGRKQPQVFGFFGIPYASPPVGLLRFMPPAALTAAAAVASNSQASSVQLMPSEQITSSVRDHTHFGFECVNLSDWLVTGDDEHRGQTPANQSEDCLNLNVFVPDVRGDKEEEEKKSVQQNESNKSNHPSQSNYPATSNNNNTNNNNNNSKPTALLNQETLNTSTKTTSKLWPLKLEQKLPVLVLFHHGSSVHLHNSKANSLIHAHLAARTRAILITFNHRTGLLGFLPFPADGAPLARTNHAIWDQLGLLHWIKHNIIHFFGDPRKVTLLAADNRANQFVQLIALTPLAKGLFTNIVLVHDELREAQQGTSHLNLLISQAQEARETHRNLMSLLSRIIQQRHPLFSANHSSVQAFIQSANLSELAQVERQVKQLESSKLFALASSPSLDDRVLFSRFSPLVAKQQFGLDFEAQKSSHTQAAEVKAELHYCLYMRDLYADPTSKFSDPLALMPPNQVHSHFDPSSLGANWPHWNPTETQQTQTFLNKSSLRRSLISSNFEHLRHAQLLADQLDTLTILTNNEQQIDQGNYTLYTNRVKRSVGTEIRMINEQQQLLNSFNLFVGYMYSPPTSPSSPVSVPSVKSPYHYIIRGLMNSTGFNYPFLTMLRLADLHFLSTISANDSALSFYCDFHSPETKINTKSTFAFLIGSIDEANATTIASKIDSNWILDATKSQSDIFLNGLTNFVKFGNPNQDKQKKQWPLYDTLNRSIKRISFQEKNFHKLERQIAVYLNLIPYLGSAKSLLSQNGSSTQSDLFGCLNELEGVLNKSVSQHDLLKEESKCLISSIARLKSQLKSYAADDFEPLNRLNRQQQPQSNATAVSPRTIITTRSDLFAQQQFQQQNTSQSLETLNEPSQANSQFNTSNSEIHENLKNIFTGAYKATVNRPLAFIVISGLVIFLLNLIIVLVIALRSSNRSKIRVSQYSTDTAETSQYKTDGEGTTAPIQLTSAIRTERNTNANGILKTSKQLKFDLPTLVEHEISQQQREDLETQPDDETQVDLSTQFLLNASSLVNGCQHTKNNINPSMIEQHQIILDSPIEFYSDWNNVQPHSSSCQQEQFVPHLVSFTSAGLSPSHSLFPSQSTTITTTTSGLTSYRQQSLRLRRNRNCQAQKGAQQMTQSPSSSTTLSMTPIQLESFGQSSNSPQQYNPIAVTCKHQIQNDFTLPYQSNSSCEQDLFIVPQYVEQQEHYLPSSDTDWNT